MQIIVAHRTADRIGQGMQPYPALPRPERTPFGTLPEAGNRRAACASATDTPGTSSALYQPAHRPNRPQSRRSAFRQYCRTTMHSGSATVRYPCPPPTCGPPKKPAPNFRYRAPRSDCGTERKSDSPYLFRTEASAELFRAQGQITKKRTILGMVLFSSGGRTRTSDLWVMSPTSCQLLHPAMC